MRRKKKFSTIGLEDNSCKRKITALVMVLRTSLSAIIRFACLRNFKLRKLVYSAKISSYFIIL
jgi:hypothetical protein